jgi:hypothetical protein
MRYESEGILETNIVASFKKIFLYEANRASKTHENLPRGRHSYRLHVSPRKASRFICSLEFLVWDLMCEVLSGTRDVVCTPHDVTAMRGLFYE